MSAPMLAPSGFLGLLVIEGEDGYSEFTVADSDALGAAVAWLESELDRLT